MSQAIRSAAASGLVSLVGCGPGDPELMTLKAVDRVRRADVLVVDRLVDRRVLGFARNDALIIDAGKEAGGPSVAQDEINRVLVREALKGQRVARLKGGDGFVFGRAVEEIAAVRAAGLEIEVIPGITAAHACAASAGLPLTMRDRVRQISLVTGATANGALDLDWAALARPGHAFAVYMGVQSVDTLREQLLRHGAPSELTMVIVENGTRDNERTIATTLIDLCDAIRTHKVRGPAIIFAGLDWRSANLSVPDKVIVHQAQAAANLNPNFAAPSARVQSTSEV